MPNSSIVRIGIFACATFAAALAGFGATTVATTSLGELLLPVGALTIALAVVFAALAARSDVFAPLGLVSIFYAATFVGGAVYFWFAAENPLTPRYDTTKLAPALWMAVLAYVCLVAGYILHPLRFVRRRRVTLDRLRVREPLGLGSIVVLLGVGWAARLALAGTGRYFHASDTVRESSGATGWITTFSDLPVLALAILAVRVFSDRGHRRWPFWAMLVIELAWALPTGSRANVLTIGLLVVVIRYYAAGGLPRARVLVPSALVVALVVFPALANYRTLENSTTNPIAAMTESVVGVFAEGPAAAAENGLETTFARFSASTSVAAAIAGGRGQIGLPAGQTYLWLPSQVVPRALWPDKPQASSFGVIFGRAYGFNNDADYNTSFAITQFLEGWFAAGYAGVVVVMLALGGIYRFIGDLLIRRFEASGTLALYGWLSWGVINAQESILASANVALVKSAVVGIVVLKVGPRVLGSRRSAPGSRAPEDRGDAASVIWAGTSYGKGGGA